MAYSGTDNVTGTESVMDETCKMAFSRLPRLLSHPFFSLPAFPTSSVLVFAISATSLCSAATQETEVGIGISLLEDGAAIYAPVHIGAHWRVEPVVSLERVEHKQDGKDAFQRELALGVGGFYRYPLSDDRAEAYVGARFMLLRRDETEHNSMAAVEYRMDSEYRGHQSNALVGVDYYFSDAFSIGGEVGLEYMEYDVEFHDELMGTDKANVSDTRTHSNLIARYYF